MKKWALIFSITTFFAVAGQCETPVAPVIVIGIPLRDQTTAIDDCSGGFIEWTAHRPQFCTALHCLGDLEAKTPVEIRHRVSSQTGLVKSTSGVSFPGSDGVDTVTKAAFRSFDGNPDLTCADLQGIALREYEKAAQPDPAPLIPGESLTLMGFPNGIGPELIHCTYEGKVLAGSGVDKRRYVLLERSKCDTTADLHAIGGSPIRNSQNQIVGFVSQIGFTKDNSREDQIFFYSLVRPNGDLNANVGFKPKPNSTYSGPGFLLSSDDLSLLNVHFDEAGEIRLFEVKHLSGQLMVTSEMKKGIPNGYLSKYKDGALKEKHHYTNGKRDL